MAEHGFGQSDKKLSQETNFYSNHFIRNKTYNKKIRLAKSRTLYYRIYSSERPGRSFNFWFSKGGDILHIEEISDHDTP